MYNSFLMTTIESLRVKEKNYRDRHFLLKKDHPEVKDFPPIKAFIKDTLPYYKDGNIVYERALSLNRSWAEEFWMQKTKRLSEEERKDFQIAVMKPYDATNGDNDFSGKFIRKIKKNKKGSHSVFEYQRIKYEDKGHEYGRELLGIEKTNIAYIVSSVVTEQDFKDVRTIALAYRRLGVKEIVLISPFFMDEREDKNVGTDDDGHKYYNGRDIKIRTNMHDLSGFIDKLVVNERHSGAIDAFGAIYGIAVAPISFEEELIGQVNQNFLTKEEKKLWELLNPDVGRTLVGNRISEKIEKTPIHLKQIRNSKTRNKEMLPLTDIQKNRLKGKNVILYDDEGGTLRTIKNCVEATLEAGIKSIHIFLGHARLQKGWRKNLNYIINQCQKNKVEVKVYVTNSRVPIGHLTKMAATHPEQIKIIPIDEKVNNMLEACIEGINFWSDKNFNGVDWERSILQAIH